MIYFGIKVYSIKRFFAFCKYQIRENYLTINGIKSYILYLSNLPWFILLIDWLSSIVFFLVSCAVQRKIIFIINYIYDCYLEQKILHSINALLLMIFLLVALALNTWLVHSILISKSICSQFLKPWNTFDDQDFYCIFQISSIRHKERLWQKKLPKIKYIRYVSRNLFVLTLNSTNNTYGKKSKLKPSTFE